MKKVKSPFNVMAFPHGPICNLACDYCYYLNKKSLYPDTTDFRMSEELLEEYTKQFIEAHPGPLVPFGWQGGEPTLRGLDFFKKALEFQQKYLPEDWQVQNAFQTNGILLDDDWCQFLKENDFLVGISIDGPADVHDVYRKDQQGRPSHQRVIDGLHKLQKHGVEYNVLCVVDDVNSQKPLDVYNFFKEEGVEFIQFIPIVETDENGEATSRSVSGEAYGRFLLEVFDEWIYHDFSEIIIQIFEECVSVWAGRGANLCVFSRTCGLAPVMEHNGDLYSCDHFVFPEYKLGNIRETHLGEMINSDKQKQFGLSKKDDLPQVCQDCDVRFMCNGGCLRNRIIPTDDGKKLNYVCSGYKQFFHYIAPYMNEIVDCLRENFHLRIIKKRLQFLHDQIWDVGRNDPCPCGSGKKFKKCCISRK